MKKNNLNSEAGDDVFLSVIIPAYNESKRIGPTLERVIGYLKEKQYKSEVIVVDDGSTDDTCDIVRRRAQTEDGLILLNGEPNHGKGYAVKRGMSRARGAYRLFMDADGSTDISELDRFLKYEERGYDLVIGSIAAGAGELQVTERAGVHRRILGSISKFLVRKLAVPDIYDTQRGFKLFRAAAAEAIFPLQRIERFGFDIELLVIAKLKGFKIKELPVTWDNPAGSKVTPYDYVRTFKELFTIVRNRMRNAYA